MMQAQKSKGSRPHIVIAGGGAGGLELAVRLGKKLGKSGQALITLIDASPTHLWKPLLHQVAAGTLDSHGEKCEYFALAHKHHFNFRLGQMEGISRADKQLLLAPVQDENGEELLSRSAINYDILVIAIGSQVNNFDTPGAAGHCVMLDTPEAAERFHQRFINQCLRTNSGSFTVTIIGGGATGVELAAELRMTAQLLSQYGLVNFSSETEPRIVIVELAERILSALPKSVSETVEQELKRIHIEVCTNERVTEVSKSSIKMASGTVISSEIAVWAAGIKAPDLLKELDGLPTNRINQLIVTTALQSPKDPAIFAFGDCAACPQGDGKPDVPARAQAAHQQAKLLAKSLSRHIRGKSLLTYQYKDYGSLISLGNYDTVGNLMGSLISGPIFIEGIVAKFMYWLLHKQHQLVINGWFHTWLTTWAEMINRIRNPRIKLH